jgi:hypothetical protein
MKKNNLFHLLALALALTTSSNALALTKTGEDTLTIAKPGSSSTKKLKLGTGEIRFDTSDSKLKFAHDGLNFKNVGSGSGSGSGVNMLRDSNPDFETLSGGVPSGYTPSGGSFTGATSGSNLIFDAASGVFNSSASSQTLTSSAITIASSLAPGLSGGNGFASCFFKTAATDYKIQAWDGTNVLAERTIPALTSAQEIGVAFPMPSSGTIAIRIVSQSDAADLAMDNCYLGSIGLAIQPQASFVGSAWIAAASCTLSRSTGTLGAFTSAAACPGPTVVSNPGPGTIQTTDTDLPKFTVNNLPPGDYQAVISASYTNSVTTDQAALAISDGTNVRGTVQVGSPNRSGQTVIADFHYTAAGNRTFELFGATATAIISLDATDATLKPITFSLYRYPTSQEQAFKPDQLPASWSGYTTVSGGCSTTSLTYADPSACTSIALTQLTNRNFGTVATAGSSLPGVTFTPARVGRKRVCATVSGTATNILTGSVRLVDGAGAVITQGNSLYFSAATALSTLPTQCGILDVTSVSAQTVKVQVATNTSTLSITNGQATGSAAIMWTIDDADVAVGAPVIVNSVTSSSSGLERIERASVLADTACVINKQSGSWLGSPTSCGAGLATFAISGFSDRPACVVALENSTGIVACRARALSQTSLTVECINSSTGASTAGNASIICMGPR